MVIKVGAKRITRIERRIHRLLRKIRSSVIFVEGRKDRDSMRKLGCERILTISGNLRKSCEAIGEDVDEVVVLTDLDRRGNELARLAKDELERYSIRAEVEIRKEIAGILDLRYFENTSRRYEKFMEENGDLYG